MGGSPAWFQLFFHLPLTFPLPGSHPVLTSWVFSYSEGLPGLQERACTFKLEKEVGEGQDAAADHGDSAQEAGVDQDEVALQGLWEGGRQDKLASPQAASQAHWVWEQNIHPSPESPRTHLPGSGQTEGKRGPSPPAGQKRSSARPPTPPWYTGSPAQTAP